jgi:hypothetical protein
MWPATIKPTEAFRQIVRYLCNSLTNFGVFRQSFTKAPQYHISHKLTQWEKRSYTSGRTDRHDEANSDFGGCVNAHNELIRQHL